MRTFIWSLNLSFFDIIALEDPMQKAIFGNSSKNAISGDLENISNDELESIKALRYVL